MRPSPTCPNRRPGRRAPLCLAAALALAGTTQAQTWNGGGSTNNWSDRFNWTGAIAPVSGPSTAMTFVGILRTNPFQNIASPFELNSLAFAVNAGAFSLSGGLLRFAGSNAALTQLSSSAVTISNGLLIADTLTYSGPGSATLLGTLGSGNVNPAFQPTLVKRGSGVLTMGVPTTFGGRIVIEEGQVRLKDGLALQSADVTVNTAGGLDLNALSGVTLGGLAGTGSLALGTTQLTVGGSGNTIGAYTGNISATTGSIRKVGAGTLQLGGVSSIDSFAVQQGGLVLDGGSLTLTNAGSGVAVGDGANAVATPAVLTLRGGTRVIVNGDTLGVDGAPGTQMVMQGSGTRIDTQFQALVGHSNSGRLSISSGATFSAAGYLLAGFNPGSNGVIDITAGGNALSNVALLGTYAGSQGTATVSGNGSLWSTITLALGGLGVSPRGGTGLLTISDGALVTASGGVDFWSDTSSITVDGGRLVTGRLSNQGGPIGNVILKSDPAGGSALTINGNGQTNVYGGRISGAGSLLKQGTGTQELAGTNSFTGRVQVSGGVLIMPNSQASEYLVGNGAQLRLGERALGPAVVEAQTGGTVVYTASSISGGLLAGSGVHDISGVQRLVGTGIANGAVLTPATGTTFAGVVNAGSVVVNAGRTFTWSNGSNTVGTLAIAGFTTVSGFSSGGLIRIVPGGVLDNTGAELLLGGGSRTTIGSANSAGGMLRLFNGTGVQLNGGLLVNNGTIQGPVSVNYGGLAKGAGSYGSVAVNDGGRFSPGNSPGAVQTGSSTWGAGGGYLVELASATGSAGTGWDLWNIDGVLDIGAGTSANSRFTISVLTLDAANNPAPLAGFDSQRGWSWQIAHASGGITGYDPAKLTLETSGFGSATGGGSFSLARDGGDLYLVFAPVPEPAAWMLLAGGLAVLLARRRFAA